MRKSLSRFFIIFLTFFSLSTSIAQSIQDLYQEGAKAYEAKDYELFKQKMFSIDSQAGLLGEPTQGVFVNGSFHYITNSPWAAYDQDGNFNPKSESLIIGLIND